MKSFTLVVLIVACLGFQRVASMPDWSLQDKAHELMDRVKAEAQEAMDHAREAASKAVESAKTAFNDAMEAAQEAKQQGREWIECGKSVAATISNQTGIEKGDEEMKD